MPLRYPSEEGCLSSSCTHPWLRAAPGMSSPDFILPCELGQGAPEARGRQRPHALAAGRGLPMGLRIMKAGGTESTPQSLPRVLFYKEREVFLLRTTGKKRIPRNEGVTKTGNFHT